MIPFIREQTIVLLKDSADEMAVFSNVVEQRKRIMMGNWILPHNQKTQVVAHQQFFTDKKDSYLFILDSVIDQHFVQFIESKQDGISFLSIDNAVKEFAEVKTEEEIVDADTNKKPSGNARYL